MAFASASSQHPLATHAAGEVIGTVLEKVGPSPDLAVLFLTGPFAGAIDDVAHAVDHLLKPAVSIGATAVSVLAGDHEIEEDGAVVLFAGSWGGRLRHGSRGLRTVRFGAQRLADGWQLSGTDALAAAAGTLLLLSEPQSFPTEAFVEELAIRNPGLTIVGGAASAPPMLTVNHLMIDGRRVDQGAVGIVFPDGAPVRALVSQGARPVGPTFTVTAARGNMIEELAGRPALERILAVADEATPEDRRALARQVHLGIALDERVDDPPVLIREVFGADRSNGAVAVDADVAVGSTVQVHARDADAAAGDLWDTLGGETAAAALVFTGVARGRRLFGRPDHDAEAVSAHVVGRASAGMFSAGEVGPVHGVSYLHKASTAMLLFDE